MNLLQELRLEDLTTEQRQIAEEIGIQAYIKLSLLCGGTRPYIAKATELTRNPRNRRIKEEFTGYNIKQLARKYDLTEDWVRKIVFENDLEGQLPLPINTE